MLMKRRWQMMKCSRKYVFPLPASNARSAYLKFGYLERPSVGVAVAFNLDGRPSWRSQDRRRMRRAGAASCRGG